MSLSSSSLSELELEGEGEGNAPWANEPRLIGAEGNGS